MFVFAHFCGPKHDIFCHVFLKSAAFCASFPPDMTETDRERQVLRLRKRYYSRCGFEGKTLS